MWRCVTRSPLSSAQRCYGSRMWIRLPSYPDHIGGLEIYTAVIDDAVRTRSNRRWLADRGLPTHEPSYRSASHESNSSLRSLALPRIPRSVNSSPGSVRRRRWEICSSDSDRFVPDESLPTLAGSRESS